MQPTEPKKETSQPIAEKPMSSQATTDVVPTPDAPVPIKEQGVIKAAAPELRGLKILGKIDIEKPKKKRSGRRGERDNRQGGQRPHGQAGGAANPSDGVKKEGQNSNDGGDPSRPPRSRIRRRVVQQGQGGQGQGRGGPS